MTVYLKLFEGMDIFPSRYKIPNIGNVSGALIAFDRMFQNLRYSCGALNFRIA